MWSWVSRDEDYLGLGNCVHKKNGKEGSVVDIISSPKFGSRVCVLFTASKRKSWMYVNVFHKNWKQIFDREDPMKRAVVVKINS